MKTVLMSAASVCVAAGLVTSVALAQPRGNEAALARIEAKWSGVMTTIRGWNADSLRQFREGYREYPTDVLEAALAARSFERMMETLDAHAAVRSQQLMEKALSKAHAMAETLPEDASNAQLVEARQLVMKSLGDDARDLVFIPVTPCTVWDTRFASNPDSAGIINNATTKKFYSHLDGAGGSYAAYGGNPSCPETAQNSIGPRPFAVMMTVYINDATANGWLTLYRDGDADPSLATISVYYSPGPTRTQTVISKSSRGYGSGTYDIAATSRFANTHASASVTGYFVKVAEVGTVTGVSASAPLASSGGNTPDISLSGTIPVANGGTGQTTLALNGILFGQGTGAVAATAVGVNGQVFAGTAAGPPTWTGSPSLSGNLTLVHPSTAIAGNIMKGSNRFIHNYGTNNTFIGVTAGNFTMTGSDNTASGSGALFSNAAGGLNTASGAYALFSNTTGASNTASGANALLNNTAGGNNIALGVNAGSNLTTGTFNIDIGNLGVAAESNTIRIGTSGNQGRAFIAGIRGITTFNADAIPVLIDSAGQLGTVSSSRRFKDDIADMDAASHALMKLRPVTFHYKTERNPTGRTLQYGLIAEEVAEVYPGLVAHSADGEIETVMYQVLPAMLLNEYQKQQRTIESQAREIAQLKKHLARIDALLERKTGGNQP